MATPKSRPTATRTAASVRRKPPAKAAAGFPAGLEPASLVADLMNHRGFVTVDKVAATFGMSKGQIAKPLA